MSDFIKEIEVKGTTYPLVSSWNDLTDKPFYEEGGTAVFPETEIPLSVGARMNEYELAEKLPLVVGEKYLVTWNGVEYECVCTRFTIGGNNFDLIGNGKEFGDDNGIPFMIAIVDAADNVTLIYGYDDASPVLLSIKKDDAVIHKLDNKYLDMEWVAKDKVDVVEIYPETSCDNPAGEGYALPTYLELVEGDTYTVVWNGTPYTLECVIFAHPLGMSAVCIGNETLLGGTNNADVPFVLLSSAEMNMTAISSPESYFTFSIFKEEKVPSLLPNKFIDAEWMAKEVADRLYIVERKNVATTAMSGSYIGAIESINNIESIQNDTLITVDFNGTKYECKPQIEDMSGATRFCIGNMDVRSSNADEGEPFLIQIDIDKSDSGVTCLLFAKEAGTCSVSAYIENMVAPPLPEKYLPDCVVTKEYLESLNGNEVAY